MKTLYRATVMLSVLGAAGWAVVEYGAAGAVRPFTTQAIELADRMLGRPGSGTSTPIAANLMPQSLMPQSVVPQTEPRLHLAAENRVPSSILSRSTASQSLQQSPFTVRPFTAPASQATGPLAQLRGLGARDVIAATWGASGQLHRVCCEVPLSNAQGMTQHFEAVAASPQQAATLLLIEIRTWQAGRGSLAAQ